MFEQFLDGELDAAMARRIVDGVRNRPDTMVILEFNFNRFIVTFEYEQGSVIIVDDLLMTDTSETSMEIPEFMESVGKRL